MKKIAVVLSGCGYLDGSAITEAVSLIVELDKYGMNCDFYAPELSFTPTSHFDSKLVSPGSRNALEESSRITRGQIRNLNELKAERYDGLAIPGGFGMAKNLSTWAMDGAACSVNNNFKRVITQFHSESKPILAVCIAPAVVGKVLGLDFTPSLTLGTDADNAAELEKTGSDHIDCIVTDFVTDRENKLISTPAYMFNASPYEVFTGISKATAEFVEMC